MARGSFFDIYKLEAMDMIEKMVQSRNYNMGNSMGGRLTRLLGAGTMDVNIS